MEKTCEKFLDAGVRVFACQKVIHPHVKCFLQRREALALERMGKELADSFAVLTGAVPLGSPTFDEVPAGCIGELESVKLVERGGRKYIFLGRDDDKSSGIATILANAAGEQQAAELKVVIHQSLQTLRHLVSKPYVLPGSGCLETWLAVQLQKKILSNLDELCKEHNCSSVEVLAVLKWFRNTFLAVSKRISVTSGSCFIVDSLYNHRWQSLDAANCACGLLTNDICDAHGAEFVDFEIEVNEEKLLNASSSKNLASLNATCIDDGGILFPKINFSKTANIDVCSSKMNAISLALEVCQSILSIGVVVY
ncbi:molecular chaperone MKKS-like [Hetaerina americana]|uniref:molecular chaperone MKKS-like n=1 Tax=Hetaerina americana TaxID=62018 RepID=UPI003A7F3E79